MRLARLYGGMVNKTEEETPGYWLLPKDLSDLHDAVIEYSVLVQTDAARKQEQKQQFPLTHSALFRMHGRAIQIHRAIRTLCELGWTPVARFHLTLGIPMRFSRCRLAGGRLVRRLNAWGLMKMFLPKAWRCPPDFEISEAADRRMKRLMSRPTQTTWSGGSLFPSGPASGHVC